MKKPYKEVRDSLADKGFYLQGEAHKFEQLVKDILNRLNCEVIDQNKRLKIGGRSIEIDLLTLYEGKRTAIEVKYGVRPNYSRSDLQKTIENLNTIKKETEIEICFIFCLFTVDYGYKSELQMDEIFIFDIGNIIFMINEDDSLKNRLLDLLPYSIESISSQKPLAAFDRILPTKLDVKDDSMALVNELEKIKPGREEAKKYEIFCEKLLKYLFNDCLHKWTTQQYSSDDMYRFDMLCKIKDGTIGFWDLIKRSFNSRYIIFEFKNYTKSITQKEIYSTEKYLYNTALRNVAIIITRNGIDDNAKKAISGALREQGKLILVLTDVDIKNILLGDETSPTDYLESLFDKFLIELDK